MLVHKEDPVLLEEARNSLADIINQHYQTAALPSADDVANSGVDNEGRSSGVRADRLAGLLTKAWKEVPSDSPPVLSLVCCLFLVICSLFLY